MPNLPMHIYIARQVADELDWGFVHDHMGSCFLGSTTPDIRAMTKGDREQTHFAPLTLESVGEGTRKMFEMYPQLADKNHQNPATRAFILGYISHLVADETWITTMYRPHFLKGGHPGRERSGSANVGPGGATGHGPAGHPGHGRFPGGRGSRK